MRQFKKILIANRGEIAVRIIRACSEMGIRSVAIYSDADRYMPHVLRADEAHHVGKSPSRESYLDMNKVLSIAKQSGADAIHPGYGFLSENALFAQMVLDAGMEFIGPRPFSIRAMGDKTEARKVVQRAGVSTIPGSPGSISIDEEAKQVGAQFGYPILLKAAAGGGGKGMRIVHRESEVHGAFSAAQSEARSVFGDDRIYVEKYLENPRHIEFQILADKHGNVIHLGERECSIQRRHQKVLEETPSVIMDEEMRSAMGAMAVAAAKSVQYENAGTIECLVDKNRNYYFLEMNTRLQVEHPITEMRTGIDIVHQQVLIAMGEKLSFSQKDVTFRGHAIECRIYAEDPLNDFLPSTGTIKHLKPSQGFGIREDRGIEQGGEISVYYDPMISKLVAHGYTRQEAIEKMKRALREYEILGVKVNIAFNLFVLNHQSFVDGNFDTHFIANHFMPEKLGTHDDNDTELAAVVAAILERNEREATTNESHSRKQPATRWKSQRSEAMR